MKLRNRMLAIFAAASVVLSGAAQAALTFYTDGDIMFVHGKAEKGDADKLKERLVPAIKTVVLRSPTGMDWDIATALGKQIEKAEVITVVHGGCYELVCPVMFLSGKQRLFSGAGRLETHWVSLYIGESTFVLKDTTTKLSDIHAWWQNHTKLSGSDVSVYRESFFSVLPNSAQMDRKVFFPIQAKYQNGNVIHCSGAAKSQQLIDCMRVPDASALGKGIITSAELFTDPRLKEPQDTPAPVPTGFAKLDAIDAVPVGDSCKESYKDFLKQPSPRAFYVNDSKGCGWQNAQSFTPNKFALSRCKQARPNGECRLYAVDDQVVFTPFDKPLPTAADVVLPQNAGSALSGKHLSVLIARNASKEDGPSGVSDKFTVEGKLVAYLTIKWDATDALPSQQELEVRWFNGDKQVSAQKQIVDLSASPQRVWVSTLAADIGVGKGRVDIYAGKVLIGSKPFSIAEKL